MALKNYQYNAIMRLYDERQAATRRQMEERLDEVRRAIPEYEALERQIIEHSMQYAKRALLFARPDDALSDDALSGNALSGNALSSNASVEQLRTENAGLSARKQELLTTHGFPADYLVPVYICRDCHDTGYVDGRRCHCFEQAAVDLLCAQSGIGSLLAQNNFDSFTFAYYDTTIVDELTGLTSCEMMHRIYDTARAFVNEFDDSFQNLLFYGNSGLGKTFLSHCIAKELLSTAHTVLYLTAYQLFDLFGKATRDEREETDDWTERILDCDLLIIDDLGTELVTAFTLSRFSSCINERQLHARSTLISTNLGLSALADAYGERVFSRLSGSYTLLRFFGDDIRLKKKYGGTP